MPGLSWREGPFHARRTAGVHATLTAAAVYGVYPGRVHREGCTRAGYMPGYGQPPAFGLRLPFIYLFTSYLEPEVR